ncbi:hypothetical protein BSPLISOX_1073 [uncultured Gammaproteobacteria bacterium]|jgi:hypothetical protein|nr:hypothetical protein BSPLISOX_1073 [uncultured Gammaproteobacteria bacterium]
MRGKQVFYFYEGETEKQLLEFLKNTKKISSGKVKKFNLWKGRFRKIETTINKDDKLFFVIDTDDVTNTDCFSENIKLLKPYNFCLIVQHKNLEDELCFSCNKVNNKKLFNDFYKVQNADKFKSKFCGDKGIDSTLSNNDFNFKKLWSRSGDFSDWLKENGISASIECNYKV